MECPDCGSDRVVEGSEARFIGEDGPWLVTVSYCPDCGYKEEAEK